jgi:hypothetical protein
MQPSLHGNRLSAWCVQTARVVASAVALPIVVAAVPVGAGDTVPGLSGEATAKWGGADFLFSVFVHRDWIFATAPGGLYRASPREKRFVRLPMPERVPQVGFLVAQPPDSSMLYFNAPESASWTLASTVGKAFGLYRCDLRGEKWELMCQQYEFDHIHVHRDGTLFAITCLPVRAPEAPDRPFDADRILASKDSGKTWTDISDGIAPFLRLDEILADPDHKDLVCLRSSGKQERYWCQASDGGYRWAQITEPEWDRRHGSHNYLFREQYLIGTDNPTITAMLSNYFDFPFGGTVALIPFELSVGGTRTFKAGERVIIPLEVKFRSALPRSITLLDTERGNLVWELRRVLPSGEREIIFAPTTGDAARGLDKVQADGTRTVIPTGAAVRPGPGNLRVHRLADRQSYKRLLDFSAICDFSTPGEYLVQLVYESGAVADSKRSEWSGSFSGPVFKISIIKR